MWRKCFKTQIFHQLYHAVRQNWMIQTKHANRVKVNYELWLHAQSAKQRLPPIRPMDPIRGLCFLCGVNAEQTKPAKWKTGTERLCMFTLNEAQCSESSGTPIPV